MTSISLDLSVLLLFYITAIVGAAIFVGACVEYRHQKIVQSYMVIMALYIGWLTGNLFLLLSPDFSQKEMFAHMRITFLTLIPPCWLYFTRELFRPLGQQSSPKYFPILFVIPAMVILGSYIWGPSPLLFQNIKPFSAFGISTLHWSAGPLLKLHLFYSYVLLSIACYYCIRGFKYQKGLKAFYSFLILSSAALFLIVELLGMFVIPEIRFLGIPALTQVCSMMSFYYILHRQQAVRSFSQNNNVLFESLPTPVVLVDREESVVLYNSWAKNIFSFNLSSVGSKIYDILPEQMTRDFPALDIIGKGHIVSLNGSDEGHPSKRYFEVIKETFSHEGEGRLLIFKDVTELKKTTQTNQRLISLMSHDLLGNLSSLEMLSRNKSDSHWDLIAETAKSSVDLLKNLLLWSSTQGNFYQPNRELLSAKELIQSCLQQFKNMAAVRQITLKFHESTVNISLKVDKKMFLAILRNLLSNAIKHAPFNSNIDIECFQNEAGVGVRVTDHGPGIDQDMVKEILANEEGRPIARDPSSEGYGIGLFVIRHFLKLHGGELEFSSPPPSGCSVTAFFPGKNNLS